MQRLYPNGPISLTGISPSRESLDLSYRISSTSCNEHIVIAAMNDLTWNTGFALLSRVSCFNPFCPCRPKLVWSSEICQAQCAKRLLLAFERLTSASLAGRCCSELTSTDPSGGQTSRKARTTSGRDHLARRLLRSCLSRYSFTSAPLLSLQSFDLRPPLSKLSCTRAVSAI